MRAYARSLKQYGRSLGRLLRTRYPSFLWGGSPSPTAPPVFCYHDVTAEDFERDLAYLARNGYETIGVQSLLRARRGELDGSRKVVLTFDDARRSFWSVALPLLRRYEARAVLFVPTAWITSEGSDAAGDRLFMTWEEIRACSESGRVEIGSHGHRHALAPTSDVLLGFAEPRSMSEYDVFEWPLRHVGSTVEIGPPPPGTPFYPSRPLLSSDSLFRHPRSAARACQEHVARNGAEEFFDRTGWEQELRSVYASAVERHGPPSPATREEVADLVRSEFTVSMASLEEKVGVRPRAMAFPWELGSKTAIAAGAAEGLVAMFGVGRDYRRVREGRRYGLDIFGRTQADWLRCLPGEGRVPTRLVVQRKLSDVLNPIHLSH